MGIERDKKGCSESKRERIRRKERWGEGRETVWKKGKEGEERRMRDRRIVWRERER